MKSIHFLPQYSAQAVVDLEMLAKKAKQHRPEFEAAYASVAMLLRNAVHIVLPENAEIYRDNIDGGSIPNEDERESFVGIPAPVVALQYPWVQTDTSHLGSGKFQPKKRITLIVDIKQSSLEYDRDVAQFFSIFYNDAYRKWVMEEHVVTVAQPLECISSAKPRGNWDWGWVGGVKDVLTFKSLTQDSCDIDAVSGFRPDITAAVQCFHALRAGAILEEQTEKVSSRRRRFEKKGVGGFTYHVLKVPGNHGKGGAASDTHASPRLHIRRAHIRKLPSGVLTFVRQCFVGDKELGVIDKHYVVGKQRGLYRGS